MSDKIPKLNRRKVLGSLGALGAASAVGAGGTYAMLSDTEQSTDNSLTMGTLNLRTNGTETATTTLSAGNLGTGTSGKASTTVNNVGTLDGVLNFDVGSITNNENGVVNDPEADDPDENVGSGELSQYVTLRLGYDNNNNGNLNSDEVVVEGALDGMENVQFNPKVPLSANNTKDFIVEWQIDSDAGNEVQSDSVEVDFTFELLERAQDADVVLTGDTPYGQGAGFANPWETTTDYAHSGSGAWGSVDESPAGSYKQGFYFAGDFSSIDALPTYTVSEIEDVSYWLYEPNALNGVDIYLNIYTKAENDGNDSGWYDSRLQALPSESNRGNPNFTPGEWNEFTTKTGASNTLTWSDTGRGGNFNQDLPTLDQLQSGVIDWSAWGGNLSISHDYRDQEALALSLQTGSSSGVDLEAYIDDITVELTTGESVTYDLEP